MPESKPRRFTSEMIHMGNRAARRQEHDETAQRFIKPSVERDTMEHRAREPRPEKGRNLLVEDLEAKSKTTYIGMTPGQHRIFARIGRLPSFGPTKPGKASTN